MWICSKKHLKRKFIHKHSYFIVTDFLPGSCGWKPLAWSMGLGFCSYTVRTGVCPWVLGPDHLHRSCQLLPLGGGTLCPVFPTRDWHPVLLGHIDNALSMCCYTSCRILLLPLLLPTVSPSFTHWTKHNFATMGLRMLFTALEDQSSSWDGNPISGQVHNYLPQKKNILKPIKITWNSILVM